MEFIFPGKTELVFPYNVIFIYPDTKEFIFPNCRSDIPCFSSCVFTIMVLHQMAAATQPANLILGGDKIGFIFLDCRGNTPEGEGGGKNT